MTASIENKHILSNLVSAMKITNKTFSVRDCFFYSDQMNLIIFETLDAFY